MIFIPLTVAFAIMSFRHKVILRVLPKNLHKVKKTHCLFGLVKILCMYAQYDPVDSVWLKCLVKKIASSVDLPALH